MLLNVIAVHGNWGHWENHGTCSVTCGGGVQLRTRVCDNPPPTHGGNQCPGKEMEKMPCNTCACASKYETLCTPIFGPMLDRHIIFELINYLTNKYIILFGLSMQPGLVGALGVDVI